MATFPSTFTATQQNILGLYRENGKENGNYHYMIGYINLGIYWGHITSEHWTATTCLSFAWKRTVAPFRSPSSRMLEAMRRKALFRVWVLGFGF